MKYDKIQDIFLRYLLVLLLGIGNFYIFREILTPLTIHTVYQILSIFTNTTLIVDTIQTSSYTIQIAPPCIATSAFYLLFFLIMSTPNMKIKTRSKAILTALGALFVLNVARILLLVPLINTTYFEAIHWIFWHLVSIVFVLAIWFTITKVYKIKSIPTYSDFKYLKKLF
ncbi:pacearchaeosortase [Methanococcoides sp. SA1]|nr:pacearchaeosortase [Methanococcoides sp. SA1]